MLYQDSCVVPSACKSSLNVAGTIVFDDYNNGVSLIYSVLVCAG